MKLANAARHFDTLPVYCAYTGRRMFLGQFDLFDDSKRDSTNIQRRTLSTAPGIHVPARRCLRAAGTIWVMGDYSHDDTWNTDVLRSKWTVHKAAGLARLMTPAQAIADSGGDTAFAGMTWTKDWKEVEFSSDVYPYYDLFFSATESIPEHAYVSLNDMLFRVRSVYISEGGFRVAEADELKDGRITVTYAGPGGYDPITDSYTRDDESIPALKMRFAINFEREQQSESRHLPGDLVVLVRKSDVTSAKPGDTVTFDGRDHRVLSVESESDCWNLVVRP